MIQRKFNQLYQLGLMRISNKLLWRVKMVYGFIKYHITIRLTTNITSLYSQESASFLSPIETVRAAISMDTPYHRELKEELKTSADSVCVGHYHIHGYGPVNLNLREQEVPIRLLDRMDYLLDLVKAYLFISDEKYLESMRTYIEEWTVRFRPSKIWKQEKSIDTAIRLLNWLWVFHFLGKDIRWEDDGRLLKSIFIQVEYIRAKLSPGGNHLILELLAIFCYGQLFKSTTTGLKWINTSKSKFIEEIERQVPSDGIHSEQSMFYHQVVTTHFLKFYLTMTRNETKPSQSTKDYLKLMLNFIHQSMKPDHTHPMLGDGDQLKTNDREHHEAQALMAARFFLFNEPIHNSFKATINDAVIWFFGKSPNDISYTDTPIISKAYRETGIVVFRDNDNYLLFDAAPFGDPEYPHHGHADALSIELCLNGETVVMDPGGYAYKNDDFRRYFRSTIGHNTIVVDEMNQSEIYGMFGYGKLARSELSRCRLSSECDFAEGIHYGYSPVIHNRQIFFVKVPQDYVLIVDFINGVGSHKIEIPFHIGPGIFSCKERECWDIVSSKQKINLWHFSNDRIDSFLIEGGATHGQVHGYVSLHQGKLTPAQVVVFCATPTLPFFFITVWAVESSRVRCSLTDKTELSVFFDKGMDVYTIDKEKALIRRNRINGN